MQLIKSVHFSEIKIMNELTTSGIIQFSIHIYYYLFKTNFKQPSQTQRHIMTKHMQHGEVLQFQQEFWRSLGALVCYLWPCPAPGKVAMAVSDHDSAYSFVQIKTPAAGFLHYHCYFELGYCKQQYTTEHM
jgi:hypothetical protein